MLMMSGYIAVLGGLGLLYLFSVYRQFLWGSSFGPEIGLGAFLIMAVVQLFGIAFITPAISAGAISGEQERQTFDLLWCTSLKPAGIVLGKLFASVAYLLLVMLASMPLYTIMFFFGGLAPGAVALIALLYMCSGLTYSAIGIMFSTLTRRTTFATVLTYSTVIFIIVGTLVVSGIQWGFAMRQPASPSQPWLLPPKLLYLNPMVALFSALPGFGGSLPMPFNIGRITPVLRYHGSVAPPPAPVLAPAWQYHLAFDGLIIVVCVALSILMMSPTGPRSRLLSRRHRSREDGISRTGEADKS